MSDDQFLARWSRRKREAKDVPDAPPPAQPVATPKPDPAVTAESPAADELDLSSLPPIDSITALTDVTAFLRKGIPPELTRAALLSRLGFRPRHSRLRRVGRECVGLQRPQCHARLRTARLFRRAAQCPDRSNRRERAQRRRPRHHHGRGATGYPAGQPNPRPSRQPCRASGNPSLTPAP